MILKTPILTTPSAYSNKRNKIKSGSLQVPGISSHVPHVLSKASTVLLCQNI